MVSDFQIINVAVSKFPAVLLAVGHEHDGGGVGGGGAEGALAVAIAAVVD